MHNDKLLLSIHATSQFVERRSMLGLLALSRFHEAHCTADKQEAFWLPCTSAHITVGLRMREQMSALGLLRYCSDC